MLEIMTEKEKKNLNDLIEELESICLKNDLIINLVISTNYERNNLLWSKNMSVDLIYKIKEFNMSLKKLKS